MRSNSWKPLLFSLLGLVVVLGFAFDTWNTGSAHEEVARSRARSREGTGLESTPLSTASSRATAPPRSVPTGPQASAPSSSRPRFDPDADTTLVVRVGGYHPPRRRSQPEPIPTDPGTEKSRTEPPRGGRPGEVKLNRGDGKRPSNGAKKPRIYVVQENDTLSTIAQRELGATARWKEIAALNGITDPRKIRLGQKLKLP